MSTTQPEALQLAQFFESMKKSSHRWHDGTPVHEKAAAELRRLHARIAEMEAQLGSSGFTAADMATAAAQGFRDGVASLAASAAPLSCGHHASMMLMSAETGNPLYCELCDSIDRRRDAETIAEERRQQLVDMKSINAQLIDALKTVRSQESDLWAPWLIKQVDAALAKRPIAEHTSASLAASAGSEPVAQPGDAEAILSKICDLFHIGKLARTESTILTNIRNVIDHAGLLHAVERDLFPHPELPEDDDPYAAVDEGLPAPNSWAAKSEADYVAQFRAALAARGFTHPSPPEGAGWKWVPKILSAEMVDAWASARLPGGIAQMTDDEANRAVAQANWDSMIDAAPPPPTTPAGSGNGD